MRFSAGGFDPCRKKVFADNGAYSTVPADRWSFREATLL